VYKRQVQDRWGLSWQIGYGNISDVGQKITPSLMFTGEAAGRAEEALILYTSVFKDSGVDGIRKYGAGEPEPEGYVMHAQFKLADSKFMIMDSSADHRFKFNEGVSINIGCKNQAEVDYYWERLTSGGGKESMCGWLSDKFGVSWQVNPNRLDEMLADPDQEKVDRVTRAFMKMRKFDIAKLERAYSGELVAL
jgi:predicted 3-demethylubiquinone-9 3-methyltransferase (glyoxalase superfamily)